MNKIIEVKDTIVRFLQENVHCQDITVIKLAKVDNNWEAIAEVYENDSFLKSMNMPPKLARAFYSVKLDDELDVQSYERKSLDQIQEK